MAIPWNKTATIVSIIVGLITIVGAGWALDQRWCQADTVVLLSQRMAFGETRFESFIISDQLSEIQKRMWTLKDRHGENVSKFPASAKEEYRSLDKKMKALEKDLERIKQHQLEISKKKK